MRVRVRISNLAVTSCGNSEEVSRHLSYHCVSALWQEGDILIVVGLFRSFTNSHTCRQGNKSITRLPQWLPISNYQLKLLIVMQCNANLGKLLSAPKSHFRETRLFTDALPLSPQDCYSLLFSIWCRLESGKVRPLRQSDSMVEICYYGRRVLENEHPTMSQT